MWHGQCMKSGEFHIVDGVERVADAGDQIPRADDKVTLVLTKSTAFATPANVMVTRLDRGPIEFVSSFSLACQALIANRASQVVVLECASLTLDEFEVRVLQSLAKGIPLVRLCVPERGVPQMAFQVSHAWRQNKAGSGDSEIRVGRLRVMLRARHFCVDDIHVPLTTTESEVLWMLASREVALDFVLRQAFKNPDAPTIGSVVRQYIHRLRRKLELSGGAASIVSIRGGYSLVARPAYASDGRHTDSNLLAERVTTAA